MEVLHFALNPGGYLMLGASESIDGAGDLFSVVDKEHRIYQGRASRRALSSRSRRRDRHATRKAAGSAARAGFATTQRSHLRTTAPALAGALRATLDRRQ
jgi:two-component system CheB/CheR fusion protein